MNTTKLAKHYESLTPEERLPLIIAACGRGDETERARLANSAPLVSYQNRHHLLLSSRLKEVASRLIARQLELAAQVFHSLAISGFDDDIPEVVRVLALYFVVNQDAWREFCAGFGVESDAVLIGMVGAETIAEMEPRIRRLAHTADEATAWLQKQSGDTTELPTVAATAEAMRQALNGQ